MARDPFSSEPDDNPLSLDAGSGQAKPASRWLAGLGVVVLVTFVAGFYAPLLRANGKLIEQQQSLAQEYRVATQEYKSALTDLERTRRERDDLKDRFSGMEQGEEQKRTASAELNAKLKKAFADEQGMTLAEPSDRVLLSIEGTELFSKTSVSVERGGKKLLCGLAKELQGVKLEPVEVTAHANAAKTPGVLERDHRTGWDLSAAMAASVALQLESCGISGEHLRAVGQAHFAGHPKDAGRSPGRVDIVLRPHGT